MEAEYHHQYILTGSFNCQINVVKQTYRAADTYDTQSTNTKYCA